MERVVTEAELSCRAQSAENPTPYVQSSLKVFTLHILSPVSLIMPAKVELQPAVRDDAKLYDLYPTRSGEIRCH